MCLKMPLALIDTKILSSTERCETITLIKTHPQQCTVSLPHLKNDFLIIFHSFIFITFSKNVSFFSCFSILFRAIYIYITNMDEIVVTYKMNEEVERIITYIFHD